METSTRSGWQWTNTRRITALGEPLLELQPAEDGGVRLGFGGDVANSMVCLSRILGAGANQISLVTALGQSSYSAWLRKRLTRERLRIIEPPIEGEAGIYGLPLDPAHGPGFSYWRTQSAARAFLRSADLGRFEELLGEPQLLLITGITLALCSAASFEHLCRWIGLHGNQCRVVLDCNFRRPLWESDTEARGRIGAFERLAAVIATGAEDERSLWGAASIPEIIARMSPLPAEYLIRGGPEGCWVGSGRECQHVPTDPVTVVDTAGAGDAHFAGYLAARISGFGRTEAAAYANRAAAVIVGQCGSAPTENARFPPLSAGTPPQIP